MYENTITHQDEYIAQQYESQDMTRDPSLESFGSAVSMQSVWGCATPDTVLSNQDLLQGELSQQAQHIPVVMGLDQGQFAYQSGYAMQYMDFQGHGGTEWTGNVSVDAGVVAYPGTLDDGGDVYDQQVAASWNYIAPDFQAHWPQQQQYHDVHDLQAKSTSTMDELWPSEAANEPPVQTVQPTTPEEGPSSPKRLYRCPYEGCDSVFDRSANLTRHVLKSKKHVIADDSSDKPEIFHCGFRICQRAGRDAIPRKDHCREHLRNFHKQDLYKRGENLKADWLEECLIDKTYWYCNKCLTRNSTVDVSSPWRCSRCGTKCEPERVAIRLQL
ncbi:hypothetical protein PpBr36_01910 [Pyricularia pennisetigena]|uniref:hypothetical protein n=1 Tax=Pyricularia pennisetigena TaxID=1578925 RepID=UPI00115039BB|nr:hypothetical protein PpBr36_01910 [Pyricularia pennisetigena]TLS28153.1 hypothetical protein PpBr36_01910 [Pyricularia pennisetigena]